MRILELGGSHDDFYASPVACGKIISANGESIVEKQAVTQRHFLYTHMDLLAPGYLLIRLPAPA